jgi:hypothetical protein
MVNMPPLDKQSLNKETKNYLTSISNSSLETTIIKPLQIGAGITPPATPLVALSKDGYCRLHLLQETH